MKRSEFIKNSFLLGLFVTAGKSVWASEVLNTQKPEKPFNLNYAPHAGMFANHAGNDILDQIKFMHLLENLV